MKLKIILIFTAILAITSLLAAIKFMGWSRIETKLTSQGTIKSQIYEVQASGIDITNLSWIDPFGRYCTTLFTKEKGGAIDCDFKQ